MPQQPSTGPVSPQAPPQSAVNVQGSPKHHRPAPTSSAPPNMQHYAAPNGKIPFTNPGNIQTSTTTSNNTDHGPILVGQPRSATPVVQQPIGPVSSAVEEVLSQNNVTTPQEYSLFNSVVQQPMWRPENESQKPVNFAAVTGKNIFNSSFTTHFVVLKYFIKNSVEVNIL